MQPNITNLRREFFNRIDSGIGIHYNARAANRLKKLFSNCALPNNEFQRELFLLRLRNLKNILEDIQVTKTMANKLRRDFLAAERLATISRRSSQIQKARQQIRRTAARRQIRQAVGRQIRQTARQQMRRASTQTQKTQRSQQRSTTRSQRTQSQQWEFNPNEKFRAWDCNFNGFSKREKEFLKRAQNVCAYPKLALYLLKCKGYDLNSACHKIIDAYLNLRNPRNNLPSLTPQRVMTSSKSRSSSRSYR